jgi:regulator of RNase E activity RraA
MMQSETRNKSDDYKCNKKLIDQEEETMAVGKRIYLKRNMPDHDIMMQFKNIPASNTADCMGRSCAMNPRIHLVSSPKDQMMVGPAFTVKCRAGDNLALHAALNLCNEGDVLVVSNEEDNTRALMGEVMMAYLYLQKKVAGIVLDGPIRDIDEIGKWDFPVYATGTTPGGPYKEGPGEVNVPIACGGISVEPGDIILADPDGVIVIPRNDAATILEDAKKFQAADEGKLEKTRQGTINRGWVDKALADKDFEFIDDVYRV